MEKILITGGTGYIGSHTAVEFLNKGYEVIIVDNLSNSLKSSLKGIEKICQKKPKFYQINLCDFEATEKIFKKEKNIDLVIHFAAFKSVNEAVFYPLKYYNNNIFSLLNLLTIMEKYNCKKMVFSSSCTVYGEADVLPVTEQTPLKKSLTAYGSSKQIGEEILEKTVGTNKINIISLRYFNPVGAHKSGLIGELPLNKPNNAMPLITKTAIGIYKQFTIFGGDYKTKDGTCIRDYIHVEDLANAHLIASKRIINKKMDAPYEVFNVGTGTGYTVLELIKTFEKENKVKVNYTIGARREGDVAVIYADTTRAINVLKWNPKKTLKDIVVDAWRWEQNLSQTKKK